MPKSVNKVILVGNIVKTPSLKYLPSGTPIAKFSLATNERFKDRSGDWQERVEWHTIVAWQRLAEIVGEFVTTGSKVYIGGKLQISTWEDRQSGQTGTGQRSWLGIWCFSDHAATEQVTRSRAIRVRQHAMKPQPRTPGT
jgi:single stranded DNA-binding protein